VSAELILLLYLDNAPSLYPAPAVSCNLPCISFPHGSSSAVATGPMCVSVQRPWKSSHQGLHG